MEFPRKIPQAHDQSEDGSLLDRSVHIRNASVKLGELETEDVWAVLWRGAQEEKSVRQAQEPKLSVNSAHRELIHQLVDTLRCSMVSERYHAVEALAKLGPVAKDARHALEEVLLADDHALVRKSAALALGELGCAECEAALRHVAEHDEDKFVRERARQACMKLICECGSALSTAEPSPSNSPQLPPRIVDDVPLRMPSQPHIDATWQTVSKSSTEDYWVALSTSVSSAGSEGSPRDSTSSSNGAPLPQRSRHVHFSDTPSQSLSLSVYSIQPYSEVYEMHPQMFDFDRFGNMQLCEDRSLDEWSFPAGSDDSSSADLEAPASLHGGASDD
jgi:hypothetical protein